MPTAGQVPANVNYANMNPKFITVSNLDEERIITMDDERLETVTTKFFKPDLIAHGTGVTSLNTDGKYDKYTGNSMATAIVTGGIAQIIQKWPFLKPDQIKYILCKNSQNIGLGTRMQGAGIIDSVKVFGVPKNKQHKETQLVTVQNTSNSLMNAVLNLLSSNINSTQSNGNGMMLKTMLALVNNIFQNKKE